jgi:hypothetical protein
MDVSRNKYTVKNFLVSQNQILQSGMAHTAMRMDLGLVVHLYLDIPTKPETSLLPMIQL